MWNAKEFPIYQNIKKERDRYARLVHSDVANLGIARGSLDHSEVFSKHFNRLDKVEHPNASRRYVIAEARMNMIEFAVRDLNEQENVDEAIDKIHDIEYLEQRDRINIVKQEAQRLAEQDLQILGIDRVRN